MERSIFDSRYVLIVVYVCGVLVNFVFAARAIRELGQSVPQMWHGSIEDGTISMLAVLDAIMVANVVYLIVAGSYLVYVKPKVDDFTFERHDERPLALQGLSPGALKEKMASALIGVSSVNLVQTLINAGTANGNISLKDAGIKVGIHLTLIVGFYAFAKVNRMEEQTEEEKELLRGRASENHDREGDS